MRVIAPIGPVYQAGTLSGNPVASAAGLATLKILKERSLYEKLNEKSAKFFRSLLEIFTGKGMSLSTLGSMFTIFFRNTPPQNFTEAKECDTKAYSDLFWKLIEQGIYMAPSQFETNFVNMAHEEKDLDQTLNAFARAL